MRATAAATITILLGLSLGACTSNDRASDHPSTPEESASQPAPIPTEPVDSPEVEKGFEETLTEGPRRGSRQFGTVEFPKGESWVKLNCTSDSKTVQLKLSLESIGEYTVGCSHSRVEKNANQLKLAASRKIRFTIEAEQEAHWIVSIQAPKK
ncbi:hypothetical protein [Streptomyces sp. V1I6]|uniref:hypothetical protein n=1 Tax=Streptomyces sp. V1I6 TaxID=3042273 RepID=UPI00277FA0CB|nr:hypothetical protein [Streptomyces sp. V1I6]MDQ0847899.1 hypothetical protein [Streptomyces sp. V1I6]